MQKCTKPGCTKHDRRHFCTAACRHGNHRVAVYKRVSRAVASGQLVKPERCQLCDRDRIKLTAHHWRGYSEQYQFDVWWVYQSCNSRLAGDRFHDGSVSISEAREFVSSRSARIAALARWFLLEQQQGK